MQSSSNPHYKLGDRVTIREWDDMEREFGRRRGVGISMNEFIFTSGMKHYCGLSARIASVRVQNVGGWVIYKLVFEEPFLVSSYSFGEEMFVETYAGPSTELRDKLMKGEFDETLI